MHEKKQINGAELREMSISLPGRFAPAHQVVIVDQFLRFDAGKKNSALELHRAT